MMAPTEIPAAAQYFETIWKFSTAMMRVELLFNDRVSSKATDIEDLLMGMF